MGATGFGSRSPRDSAATRSRRRTGSGRSRSADERHGAGIFVVRLRTRNGVIPAKENELVLVEFDGPRDELEAKYGFALPPSLAVVSRRGEHVYLRAPDGCPPGKFEIADSGVSWSGDGVLISAGSLHESGHIYRFVDPEAPLLEPTADLYRGSASDREAGRQLRPAGRRPGRADPQPGTAARTSSRSACSRPGRGSGRRRSCRWRSPPTSAATRP